MGLKMLEIDNAETGLLAYSIDSGDIPEEASSAIWQRFDDAKAKGEKIRIYAEMLALPKVSGKLVIEKLKRLGTIFSTLDRMAIVGDAGWMDIYAKIVDPITKFEVKHFTVDQKEEAIAWMKE
ncbi:MAG: STAS/SEC14 domain-containing protein [Desulfobulbia bacterium]